MHKGRATFCSAQAHITPLCLMLNRASQKFPVSIMMFSRKCHCGMKNEWADFMPLLWSWSHSVSQRICCVFTLMGKSNACSSQCLQSNYGNSIWIINSLQNIGFTFLENQKTNERGELHTLSVTHHPGFEAVFMNPSAHDLSLHTWSSTKLTLNLHTRLHTKNIRSPYEKIL